MGLHFVATQKNACCLFILVRGYIECGVRVIIVCACIACVGALFVRVSVLEHEEENTRMRKMSARCGGKERKTEDRIE